MANIQHIEELDTGEVAAVKLNQTIDEANKVEGKVDKVPSAIQNNLAIFDNSGGIKDGGAPGSQSVDYIDFNPQNPNPNYSEARIFYNGAQKTFTFYTDIEGANVEIGSKLQARIKNDTAGQLLNGTVVSVFGLDINDPGSLFIELTDASDLNSALHCFGVISTDIDSGNDGFAVRFGLVFGIDTSAFLPGDILYADPENPGGLTNVRPKAPNYVCRVCLVVLQDINLGAIAIDTQTFNSSDTAVNLEGAINGIVTQTPDVQISVSGGIIYADVTNENYPLENLPFLINGMRYKLDTTTNTGPGGAARVVVPPGPSATEAQLSYLYIYLNAGIPTLAIATSEPSIPFAKVANIVVFDAARTASDGKPLAYRRSNNAIDLLNGTNDGAKGIIEDILSAIREKLGSNWISGQDATPTVNNTTIQLSLTAGIGRQFRRESVPIFDGTSYLIYNDATNTVTYQASTNLTDIVTDASGNTLLTNNTFYTIRIFYQLNSNGIGDNVIATRPLGAYDTLEDAIQDPSNYTVNVNDTNIEEVIYPIYDLVISRTGAGGTTITLGQLTDLRSKLPNRIGGGGASGSGGANDQVRISAADTISDYLNPKFTVGDEFTKEIVNPGANETLLIKFKGWIFNIARTFKVKFNTENLTADRIVTFQDKQGSISLVNDSNHVPIGGTTGQSLKKNSNADYDTIWQDDSPGNIYFDDVLQVQLNGLNFIDFISQNDIVNDRHDIIHFFGSEGNVNNAGQQDGTVKFWDSANSHYADKLPRDWIEMACSDEESDLEAKQVLTNRARKAFTLLDVRASVNTAPSSALVVDVKKNGISVLSTNLTIDAGEKTSVTAATPPVISTPSFADDDEYSIDIVSTTGGRGLKVAFLVEYKFNF